MKFEGEKEIEMSLSGDPNDLLVLPSTEDNDDNAAITATSIVTSTKAKNMCNNVMISLRRLGPRRLATVIILFLVNFFNYVDRFVCAAMLVELENVFNVEDNSAGLLQTCFFASYMLAAPVFGYLGDRHSRKHLMAIGLIAWALVSASAAFVPTDMFWLFLLLRALIGVGEASYATLCPTVISDMFIGEARTMVLLVYSVAVPLGCGAAYIITPAVRDAFDTWRAAFFVVPIAILILTLLLILIVHEPIRGQADGLSSLKPTSFRQDLIYLVRIPSFVLVTLGFVGLAFCLGAISFFCPTFFNRAYLLSGNFDL